MKRKAGTPSSAPADCNRINITNITNITFPPYNKEKRKGDIMNYICIFTLIFLGILGSVSCVTAIGEMLSCGVTDYPPTVVRYCGEVQLESRVRALLKTTRGDIIVLIPENVRKNSEYFLIAKRLAEENGRVTLKRKKKYIHKKGSC